MTLLRRKAKPTPPQKALDIARLGVRGLVAQRVARTAFKGYKFLRRLPLIIGGLGVAAFVARKARGGAGTQADAVAAPTPPATTTSSAPAPAAATTSSAPNPAETAGTGTPPVAEPVPEAVEVPEAPTDSEDLGATAAGTASTSPSDAALDSPDDAELKP